MIGAARRSTRGGVLIVRQALEDAVAMAAVHGTRTRPAEVISGATPARAWQSTCLQRRTLTINHSVRNGRCPLSRETPVTATDKKTVSEDADFGQ
jgi:hypothetical protein